MKRQDLLHHADDVAATSAQLMRLLARVKDAARASGACMQAAAGATDDERVSLLLQARMCAAASAELLVASERLLASSQVARNLLAPMSRAMAAASRAGRAAHRDQIGSSLDAISRSRTLLAQPVLRPETAPPWQHRRQQPK